jgi:hypothetical protein
MPLDKFHLMHNFCEKYDRSYEVWCGNMASILTPTQFMKWLSDEHGSISTNGHFHGKRDEVPSYHAAIITFFIKITHAWIFTKGYVVYFLFPAKIHLKVGMHILHGSVNMAIRLIFPTQWSMEVSRTHSQKNSLSKKKKVTYTFSILFHIHFTNPY